jgi:hypothetical protein
MFAMGRAILRLTSQKHHRSSKAVGRQDKQVQCNKKHTQTKSQKKPFVRAEFVKHSEQSNICLNFHDFFANNLFYGTNG